MRPVPAVEFPEREGAAFRRARRLEVISILYLASAAAFIYLVMGSSQAMRTSWLEDLISMVPPLAFLIASRIAVLKPSKKFPYGMHSAVSIGYLTSALALLGMGLFLLIEAGLKLAQGERVTIGGFELFGTTIWAGWPMLAALAYTGIPSFFLGRAKQKLAPIIHDKILYADAEMNRADWMAESAAAIGVIGAGFGFWWADPAAAGLVSLDILRDGVRNLRAAVTDLMDEMPKKTVEPDKLDPLPGELERYLETLPWIEKAQVRMRENGHVFFGEAFVVPRSTDRIAEKVAEAAEKARKFNWRVGDLTVTPVAPDVLEKD
jgi:divalent metal cation (Fe/Co/Zn/Cd) transporter